MSRIDDVRTQADADALRADLDGPIIEPVGGGRSLATFCWFGDDEAVSLLSPLTCRFQVNTVPLERVGGTDLWHIGVEIPDDVRTTYQFCIGPDPFAADIAHLDEDEEMGILLARMPQMRGDPFNERRLMPQLGVLALFDDPTATEIDPVTCDSVVEGPAARPTIAGSDLPHTQHRIGERTVWAHVPDDVDPATCPVVVLLDGRAFRWIVPAASVAAAHGAATVLVGNRTPFSRGDEFSCVPAFADHLADEVVGLARSAHGLGGPVVIGGASLGGLGAAYAAIARPDAFDAVVSMSGSFWWGPPDEAEWLADHVDRSPEGVRWSIAVGAYDPDVLPFMPGRSMRSVNERFAEAVGASVRVYPGGHEFAAWHGELDVGLGQVLA